MDSITLKEPATKEEIHLIPVNKNNAFLGNKITVTSGQINSNLVLSIPEAISAAFENQFAEPHFICLNDEVIGYTALVFDKTIPNEEDCYWLWQFTIDKGYQGKGYGGKALEIVIEKFHNRGVPGITLSTKPDNDNALYLYQKFGFELTGDMNDDEVVLKKWMK